MTLFKTNANGQIVETIDAFNADLYQGYQSGDVPEGATHYQNGTFLTKPAQPSPSHRWDDTAFVWNLDLSVAKQLGKERINAAREHAKTLGFPAYGKFFDSDAVSRENILIAVSAASVVGAAWAIDWTTADNSVITLDYAQMMSLPVLMAQHGDALHIKARALKEQIDAATTQAEIDAANW